MGEEVLRPDWPSLKRVEAADGSSSLVLQGPSFNRDIPGQILLFTKDDGAAQIAICATVGDVTPLKAALEAESEALDHSKWPYGQRYAYLKAFDDKHGRTFEVVEFRVLQKSERREHRKPEGLLPPSPERFHFTENR